MVSDKQPDIPLAILRADPGLPQPNPTESYWQRVPHALANAQSPSIQQTTDFAVIGSGITGLSVSKTILEQHPSAKVTVLEARTLCSGATGRNGGQLVANAGEEYLHLAQAHGPEMAGKIIKFTFLNVQKMQDLINECGEESEHQQVQKLRVFLTPDVFESFKQSVAQMEADHPSLMGIYTILDADSVLKVDTHLYYGFAAANSLGLRHPRSSGGMSTFSRNNVAISHYHQNIFGFVNKISFSISNRDTDPSYISIIRSTIQFLIPLHHPYQQGESPRYENCILHKRLHRTPTPRHPRLNLSLQRNNDSPRSRKPSPKRWQEIIMGNPLPSKL